MNSKVKITESRNKREGKYCGRTTYCKRSGQSRKRHHSRAGSNPNFNLTIKD